MREKDLVSVIITSFNREKFLKDCLESIWTQTYRNIEIILVDDCSTDNTFNIFHSFKERVMKQCPEMENRLIAISLPRNIGYEGPLTLGMFLSKGEFIAIQDSDDISHPERIQKQIDYLKANPHYDLVGTLYSHFNDYRNGIFTELSPPKKWIKFDEEINKVYRRGGHCICHGTTLLRGRVFDRLGGFTRRFKKTADAEFIRKCILNGVKANNIPEVLYYYRQHPEQMSKL